MAEAPKRVYSQEEVNAILSRAIERQQPEGALSLEEVRAAAREAGISTEAIDAAAAELDDEREKEVVVVKADRGRVRAYLAHLTSYVFVIGFLVYLNIATGGPWWAQWPALGWGFGLVMHTLAFLMPDREREAKRAARRAEREAHKRARLEGRKARRERKHEMEDGARELGKAVERAASTLLAATAKKIHEEVDRAEARSPRGDAPAGKARARVDDDARAVRVGKASDDDDALDERDEEEDAPRKVKRR